MLCMPRAAQVTGARWMRRVDHQLPGRELHPPMLSCTNPRCDPASCRHQHHLATPARQGPLAGTVYTRTAICHCGQDASHKRIVGFADPVLRGSKIQKKSMRDPHGLAVLCVDSAVARLVIILYGESALPLHALLCMPHCAAEAFSAAAQFASMPQAVMQATDCYCSVLRRRQCR